jgi:hypothetical protein
MRNLTLMMVIYTSFGTLAGCNKSPCSDPTVLDTVKSLIRKSDQGFAIYTNDADVLVSGDISDDNTKTKICVATIRFVYATDITSIPQAPTIEEALKTQPDKDKLIATFYSLDNSEATKLLGHLKNFNVIYVTTYLRTYANIVPSNKQPQPPVGEPAIPTSIPKPLTPMTTDIQVEFTAAPLNDNYYVTIRSHGHVQ